MFCFFSFSVQQCDKLHIACVEVYDKSDISLCCIEEKKILNGVTSCIPIIIFYWLTGLMAI